MLWSRFFKIFAVFGAVGAADVAVALDAETDAWYKAAQIDTRDAYEGYLALYPTGRFAREAFAAIVERDVAVGLTASLTSVGPDDGIY